MVSMAIVEITIKWVVVDNAKPITVRSTIAGPTEANITPNSDTEHVALP